MMQRDGRGIAISGQRPASLEAYEQALTLLNGYRGNPLGVIDSALAEDPEFVAGHVLRAALLVTSTERRALPELRRTVEQAEVLVARGLGNDRERALLAAARAWLDGDFARATDRYNRVALEHPRDLLALQIGHVCNFFLGRASWLRDHVAACLPHFAPTEPGYGYLSGMLAFGLEECHDYAAAEQAGRRALEINRGDVWAVHAVAHVFEMQGRLADGSAWLEQREPDWAPDNFFAIHNYWHLALFNLDLGDHASVLGLYDQQVRGGASEVIMDLVDASALLWRLELAGVDVSQRWHALAEVWRRIEEEGFYAFNDWHALMAYAGAGARNDVTRVLEGLVVTGRTTGSNAEFAREVALPACRGFAAFADGDYASAVDALYAVRPLAHRFGGSHAQRDVLDATLLEAAVRDKQFAFAQSLAQARKARKPDSPAPLRMLARLYAVTGAPESAGNARQEAERLAAKHRVRAA